MQTSHSINVWMPQCVNVWTNGSCFIMSETEPPGNFQPVVSENRVQGSSYRPYLKGSPEWRYRANQQLAQLAYANLEHGSRAYWTKAE